MTNKQKALIKAKHEEFMKKVASKSPSAAPKAKTLSKLEKERVKMFSGGDTFEGEAKMNKWKK